MGVILAIELEEKYAQDSWRERFKKDQLVNLARSSGHPTTRMVDCTALKGRQVTFLADVTTAFLDVKGGLSLRAATERILGTSSR